MTKRILAALAACLFGSVAAYADSTVPSLPLATSLTSAATYLAQTGASNNQMGFLTSVFGLSSGALTINSGGITNAMLTSPTISINSTSCTLGSACTISGGGGGDTITSPNGTLVVGGTSSNTTLDFNLSHSNTWLAAQTIPGLTVTGSFTATGLVTNADLANPSVTVNGTTCTLGSSCTPSGGSGVTSIATTAPIAGGTITTTGTLSMTGPSNLTTFTAGTVPMGATTSPFAASEITDVASGGVTIGSPTGGQKGAGTINMTGCFINNVPCAAGSSVAWSTITGGTLTSQALVVGSAATLSASGGGAITATAAPISGLTGAGTGVLTFLATPSSANLAAAVTDETGSGALVFGTSPTIASPTVTGSFTATGLVTNADLVSASMTVNGTTCTLGSSCTPSGGSLTVGSVTGVTNIDPGNGVLATAGASGHANLLLTNTLRTDAGATPALASTDAAQTVVLTNAAPALTIPAGGGSGLTSGFSSVFVPTNAGTFKTVTSTVNGIAGATGIKFGAYQGSGVMVDGSNNYEVFLGLPQPATQTHSTVLYDDMVWGAPSGAVAFSALTSGANSTAAMSVQTGASMAFQNASLTTLVHALVLGGPQGSTPTFASNDEGAIFTTVANGLVLGGKGSSQDVELINGAGTSVCAITTGTTALTCVSLTNSGGTFTLGGTLALSGTVTGTGFSAGTVTNYIGLDASNHFVTSTGTSGSTAFGSLTSGTNTTAAMVVGTGASIAPTGSGAITATVAPVAGLTGAGTGVLTALAVNVGSAGAPVINGGALGTPSSGTLTNATGLPFSGLGGATNTTAAMVVGTGSSLAYAGTTLPTQGAGTLGIAGEAATPTMGANGEGDVFLLSTTGGLAEIGKGSTNDHTWLNSAGTTVCNVPTGTVQLNCNTLSFTSTTGVTETMTISTATFTPDLGAGINHQATLIHASCPCTMSNPSNITTHIGETGMIDIIQSSTGSDTIGTWGSEYITPGGTSTLTLSTAANAVDHIAYRVIDSTHVLLGGVQANATH